jgi:hypothetical protein
MLTHVRGLMRPGGQVWISCPNAASHWRKLFGRQWINWHVPFHLWHFTPHTFTALLNRAKFSVQEMHTCTPALWLTQSVIGRWHSNFGLPNKWLRSAPLIAGLMLAMLGLVKPFRRGIDRKLTGDCMIVTAKPLS